MSTVTTIFRHSLLLGLATAWVEPVRAQESAPPARALGGDRSDPAGRVTAWAAAGPWLFAKPAPDAGTTSGFRPFWVHTTEANGAVRTATALYPLFTYRADADTYAWSFLELIKRSGRKDGAPAPQSTLENSAAFEVWPFWFSRRTDDPADSYRALFPVAGTLKRRLGFEALSWKLFPLHVEAQHRGATTTWTPWPFIRKTHGAAHGFALWPLFGWQERPGVSRDEFLLWPLGSHATQAPAPDAPAGTPPARQFAALPFYARQQGPGFVSETFLWPFFGYTDRTAPSRYHETRYLWPFFVQGRGDDRAVNRWGPFYTHSVIKGLEKTWIGWPLYREQRWTEQGLAHTKTQGLWRLYWSLEQRSATNPALAPATLRHVWPLFSTWDNGAGRRQIQALSPFEVFFPGNTPLREVWAPLFSLYRYDQRAPGHERHALLWDLIVWENHAPASSAATPPAEPHRSTQRTDAPRAGGHEERLALARGFVGLRRPLGERAWRLFWLDFSEEPAVVSGAHSAVASVR